MELTKKRPMMLYVTKEKLVDVKVPDDYKPSVEAMNRAAEQMRVAMSDPNNLPLLLRLIELEL